jgi:hypothetical protein
MVRLGEFFSGEKATMARNVRSQRPRASDEQRAAKKEAEKYIITWWRSDDAATAATMKTKKPQARERLGRVFRTVDPSTSRASAADAFHA